MPETNSQAGIVIIWLIPATLPHFAVVVNWNGWWYGGGMATTKPLECKDIGCDICEETREQVMVRLGISEKEVAEYMAHVTDQPGSWRQGMNRRKGDVTEAQRDADQATIDRYRNALVEVASLVAMRPVDKDMSVIDIITECISGWKQMRGERDRAAANERARIVEWLEAKHATMHLDCLCFDTAAESIARGEHHER